MINQLQNLKPQICDKHNQPIIMFQQSQPMCLICINQQPGMMTIDQFYQQLEKISLKENLEKQQQLQLLQSIWDSLDSYQTNINKHLEKILQVIKEQIEILKTQSQEFQSLIQKCNNQQKLTGELEKVLTNTQESNQSVRSLIEKMLIDFKHKQCQMDPIIELLKQNPVQDIQAINNKSQSENVSTQYSLIIDKKFDYQLIQQSSFKEKKLCSAIAFNKDSTLALAGYDKFIKVFEFKDDKLKEIQQLNGHTSSVYCLQFLKKSNQFISGSGDSTIIIWEQQKNNQWQSIQVLKAHTSDIYTITINKNEDILISGSGDNTIKFWDRENNTWISKQSIECSKYVASISLSNNEDTLIASIRDKQILVIQLQNKSWIINQKISVEQNGSRLCFINQNQFVFQPIDRQYLQIYDYDEREQKYKQGEQVKYQNKKSDGYWLFPDHSSLFPICYIQQMGLILVKNGEYVHLIKRTQNRQYTVEQSIHFGIGSLYGCISDDGRYIATWDHKSYEIQIRKFNY